MFPSFYRDHSDLYISTLLSFRDKFKRKIAYTNENLLVVNNIPLEFALNTTFYKYHFNILNILKVLKRVLFA